MPDIIRPTYGNRQDGNTSGALVARDRIGHDAHMRKLADIRRSRGLSQGQLADMAGVTQATVSRIESGKLMPRIETIEALASALRVPPGALFDVTELQERVLSALARMPQERIPAALEVLEAMAEPLPPS